MYVEVDEQTMAAVLVDMEKLGFLKLTEHGRSVFNYDRDSDVATKDKTVAVGQIGDWKVATRTESDNVTMDIIS